MASLRERQLAAIRKMLGASPHVAGAEMAGPPEWKVLVYDSAGQDILAPLLNVAALREYRAIAAGLRKLWLPFSPCVSVNVLALFRHPPSAIRQPT